MLPPPKASSQQLTANSSVTWYARRGKRLLDLALAVPLAVLAGPPLLLAAGLLAGPQRGRVLFRQVRPGWRGRPFTLYKLQTMTERPPPHHRPAAARCRSASAGGRALAASHVPRRAAPALERAARRPEPGGAAPAAAAVPAALLAPAGPPPRRAPGLTGWAQVNGRNAISWEEKFRYDVWYAEHLSLGLDLRILWRTAGRVLTARGITAPGEATTSAFTGSTPASDFA